MWAFYKRQFVKNQVIIAITLVGLFLYNVIWPQEGGLKEVPVKLVLFWGILEVMLIPGAWWGARLQRRIQEAQGRLPLDRK